MHKKIINFLGIIGIVGFICGAYINFTNPSEGQAPMGLILVIISFFISGSAVIIDWYEEKSIFYIIILFLIILFLILRFTGIFAYVLGI